MDSQQKDNSTLEEMKTNLISTAYEIIVTVNRIATFSIEERKYIQRANILRELLTAHENF